MKNWLNTFAVLVLLGSTGVAHATRMIGYPIDCSVAIQNDESAKDIAVTVIKKDEQIKAVVRDGWMRTQLNCAETESEHVSGYVNLECSGVWADGSEATLGTPLDTYVPMLHVKRAAALGGNEIFGICYR